MEAIIDDPLQDGEEPKNCNEVISQVMPKTKFLQNVGLESAAPKRNGKAMLQHGFKSWKLNLMQKGKILQI